MRPLILITLVLALAAALALVLLATLPVRVIDRIAPLPEALDDPGGTVWNGRALWRQPGQPPLEVSWRWRPPTAWDWLARDAETEISGRIRPGRGLYVEAVNGHLDTRRLDLEQWLHGTRALGRFVVDLERLQADGPDGPEAVGSARWENAELVGQVNARLGTVEIDFEPAPGPLARFRSTGAAEVRVDGEVLRADSNYRLEARLRADPDRPELVEALGRLGQVEPDGSVRVRYQGPLGW